jgi:isopentenyl diphosphate isomerase/L-lactate dehydrogenase-like FMN-dependent dehydrogenase
VREVLDNLRAELDITMTLSGCDSLAAVGPDTLRDVA